MDLLLRFKRSVHQRGKRLGVLFSFKTRDETTPVCSVQRHPSASTPADNQHQNWLYEHERIYSVCLPSAGSCTLRRQIRQLFIAGAGPNKNVSYGSALDNRSRGTDEACSTPPGVLAGSEIRRKRGPNHLGYGYGRMGMMEAKVAAAARTAEERTAARQTTEGRTAVPQTAEERTAARQALEERMAVQQQ